MPDNQMISGMKLDDPHRWKTITVGVNVKKGRKGIYSTAQLY